ncbi:MAG TPA: endonuclease/exonuclease/phosphatase family protein [Caulobacteraceae bacterium]|nr:endonuclease/exonuclease/phosphatase family protein [Caulobacteraceae bacterium]
MPIQIRVMSWNIQKKTGGAAYIAETMRSAQIDICALLEMPNSNVGTTLAAIIAALNNLGPAYHQNEWLSQSVNVGSEAVGFIWHQNNAVGPNAFQVDIKANGGQRVCGAVTRDTNNFEIFFPKTQTTWASLPGRPAGRRPAYLSFVTNDGAAQRRFTVLDLHTPFNTNTSIQSYATGLMATSREITHVDRTDLADIATTAAAAGLAAAMAGVIDPIINGMGDHSYVTGLMVRNLAVAGAVAAIDGTETDLHALVKAAGQAAARHAANNIPVPNGIVQTDAQELAQAIGIASACAAATLVASAQLPTAPVGATGSALNAGNTAIAQAQAVVGQLQLPTKRRPGISAQVAAVRGEAERIADWALWTYAFNPLPLTAVNASIIAGDFNVDYPDTTVYQAGQQISMGGANAYTRMLALGAARNTAPSTRIGPTAFRGQLVYQLALPCQLQNTNKKQIGTYVPLSMAPLVGTPTSFMNWTNWIGGLQLMANTQGIAWASLSKNFGDKIDGAFNRTVNNDTRYYRANCYDNIFVRGGAVIGGSGVVDVLSALGSWGAGPVLPNPVPAGGAWAAASGQLNGIASAYLGALPPALLTYGYDNGNVQYTITAALADGIEAAVFFDRYISDHLPVAVAVQV